MKQKNIGKSLEKGETQAPYELAETWKWVKLEEVLADIKSGFACSRKYETEDGIPHLRPNNIGFNEELDFSKLVHIPQEMVDLTKYSLRRGDVLFNNTNSKELVGRASLVKADLNYGYSNHITRLRINKNLITSEWLVLSINYLWLQGYFLKICQKWIGQAGVNTKMLKSTQIALPPLEEQKRIAARIEDLFRKLDEMKRVRKETNAKAKALVSSALHEVFSKASEKGWEWVKLGEICETKMGGTPKTSMPEYWRNPDIIWITPEDMEKDVLNRIYDSRRKISRMGLGESSAKLFPSETILLTTTATIGKTGIAMVDLATNQQVTGILCPDELCPSFLGYYFLFLGENKLKGLGGAVTATHINQRNLRLLQIPLPDFEQQKRIVAYLDKIQEKSATLQKLQKGTGERITKLRASILNRALRGEL